MISSEQILKYPILKKGEDFSLLREEGISLIQKYSGKTWTDHNLHDPGITLLEAFCYALTELTLKSNLDIKDILASAKANSEHTLFSPEDILPSCPTTLKDYQKLLIDTEGVRNGWLTPIPSWEANDINGLYDVLLELEDHDVLGEINSSIFLETFSIGPKTYTIDVSFPPWDEVREFYNIVSIDNIGYAHPDNAGLFPIELDETEESNQNNYIAKLRVFYNAGSQIEFSVAIKVSPEIGGDGTENNDVENEIKTILSDISAIPGAESMLVLFNRKVAAAAQIETAVWEKLWAERNLAEDIRDIKAIRIQEIGLNTRIDLLKAINLEKYLASVLFKLETFFKPIIKFSALQTLKSENISFENIYDGPLLQNGFLDDTILKNNSQTNEDSRNNTVYVSDLVNILITTAFENNNVSTSAFDNQIITISSITISSYLRNKYIVKNAEDCLLLANPEIIKPRFSFSKSNISFFRNGIEVSYNEDLVTILLDNLRLEAQTSKDTTLLEVDQAGETLAINEFYSIQHDFPPTFGLGDNVLSDSYSQERRAKVEQFRGYLTLIDQLLASFSNQLYHVNDLFSIDPEISNSYYKDTLYNVPYIERLLQGILNNTTETWEDFKNNLDNDYQKNLDEIFEIPEVFLDRRNRFLDHFMSRFGTSIDNYVSYKYEESSMVIADSDELNKRQLEIAHDVMNAKIRHLKMFVEHSRGRFKALNYNETPWNTQNTSGLAKRLLSTIGLTNLERRALEDDILSAVDIIPNGPNFEFEIKNVSAEVLLENTNVFANAVDAQNASTEIILSGIHRDFYFIEPEIVGSETMFRIGFRSDESLSPNYQAQSPELFETEYLARIGIRKIINGIKNIGSGLFVVEHLLLRPLAEAAVAPTDLVIPLNSLENVEEPFSMRITIVLPSGFERDFDAEEPVLDPIIPAEFQDNKFRNLVLRQLNEELPAHVYAHVYWLDRNTSPNNLDTPSLENFTDRWRAWLEAKENDATTIDNMQTATNNLIAVLNNIYQL